MENYKNVDIGYEFWNRGYMFHNLIEGEREAYNLWVDLCERGIIRDLNRFFVWILKFKPDMIYDYREEDRKYRERNEPKIREYFTKHIKGKTWAEIDPGMWSFYSDWHKDVFGYRPHGIVCGEYINPHL